VDELIVFLQKFGPLVGGILVPLGGLVIKWRAGRGDPAAVRSMKQHAKLHEALPEKTRGDIEELIKFEANKYAAEQMRIGRRTIKGGNLAAVIFIALVFGGLEYVLIAWGLTWWPGFIFATAVGVVGLAFIIAGSLQIFDYGDSTASTTGASGGAAGVGAPAEAQSDLELVGSGRQP
jgi:ABC-type multidrug transport system fused ATPase/permease subunit